MKLLANFYACLTIILLIGLLKAAEGRGVGGGGGVGRKHGIHEMEQNSNHFMVRRHAPKMTEEDHEAPQRMDKTEEPEKPRARRAAVDEPEEPEEPKQFRVRRQVSVDEPEEPEELKQFRTRRQVSVDEPEEPEEPQQIRSRRQMPEMPMPQMPDDIPMPPMSGK